MSRRAIWGPVLVMALLLVLTPARAVDTLQAIHDAGTISLGYRAASPPFSASGPDGQPAGYSIEICLHVIGSVRRHLGRPDLKVEWVEVNPDTRLSNIAFGRIHIECGSTTNTLSRQSLVDFSYPIYLTGSRLLVRRGEDLNSFKDLDGKVLAIIAGTTTESAVQRQISGEGLNVRLRYVDDHNQGFDALASDQVDAYATDDVLLYGLIAQAENAERYEVIGRFLSYEPYGLVLPRNDSDFRRVVNGTLARLFRTRTIEQIHGSWFDPLGMPMPDLLRAAFIVNGVPD